MEDEPSVEDPKPEEMLQQLRQWQQEQKNRLMEQQQQQRLVLLEKQKKLLSMINTAETSNIVENESNEPNSPVEHALKEDRQAPLKSPSSVDDVPLKRPRSVKTFQQLLETSLNTKEQSEITNNHTQTRKFPFLKRGQGISRFGTIPKPKKENKQTKGGKENKAPSSQHVSKQPVGKPPTTFQPTVEPLILEPAPENRVNFQVERYQHNDSVREGNSSRTNEEDLAVFELLERFATINASFSSSSSLIGQLLDKGVTHLPSPSKVITFLTKKRSDYAALSYEDTSASQAPKSSKIKHVHFAEVIEEDEPPKINVDKPWLPDISEESEAVSPISPYVSNTFRPSQQLVDLPKPRMNLDETPTSPIGFPDYQKLFGNPARALWSSGEHTSPDDQNTQSETQSGSDLLKDLELPSSLPIEDPRLVYQTSLVRSRLTSLEREISNYRKETDTLRRARKEHEESKLKLEQEQEKFRRYTENEKRRLQLLYGEEQKRLRSEQLKDLPQLKESEEEITRLKGELRQAREDHRQKESKWMASQTNYQEKIRTLEIRNRELSDSMEKLRGEEQSLRRRLNASLRPGAMSKNQKENPILSETKREPSPKPQSPRVALSEAPVVENSPRPREYPIQPIEGSSAQRIEKPQQVDSSPGPGGVSQTILPDGTKLLLYTNGNRKEIWPNGKGSQVIYYNGDVKQKLADGSVIYNYADSGTKHTTKPDGTDILEFSSGQIETTYPDGRSQVQYPGGAQKMKYPDGREEAQWPDGTKLWTDGKGHGVMTFPSGMREIYTPICKRREYPDGTVKTVYEDGRSETRYGNGRIRVKDGAGNVITDTGDVPTK